MGLAIVDFFGIPRHDYFGRNGKNSIWEWNCWKCHKTFGVICYIQILLLIHFLTGFFLNNVFYFPSVHFFPIYRLLQWFAIGLISFREAWEDVKTWNTPGRQHTAVEGRYRWLTVGILIVELMVCWKYKAGTTSFIYDVPTPIYIWLPWVLFLGLPCVFWVYLRFKPGHTVKYPGIDQEDSKVKS